MKFELSIYLYLFFACFSLHTAKGNSHCDDLCQAERNGIVKIRELKLSESRSLDETAKVTNRLDVYCLDGRRPVDLKLMWSSITLRLLIASEKYAIYKGHNASVVFVDYQRALSGWIQSLIPWRSEHIALRPFNLTCIGIATLEKYSVRLHAKVVDPWLVSFLVGGTLLFFSANKLSRNILFYYGSGISVGLLASLLILIFVISRFIPQKTGAYAVLFAGWSVTLWLLQYIWENIQMVLEEYYIYVASYFAIAAFISWAVCYYKGPPSNPRALNLIKWAIQAFSLLLIYNGTQIPEVSFSAIAAVLLLNLLSTRLLILNPFASIINCFRTFWRRRFPPKVKLITAEEFDRQGAIETQKALEDLRQYCRSPDCNAWKTISRVRTPTRFARFVEGESHLTDEEVFEYDASPLPTLNHYSEDEDEIDFRLNSL